MSVDITQLIMEKYYINELEKQLNRDRDRLKELKVYLEKRCTHPEKYLRPANIAYDMNAKICELCERII